MILLSVVIPLYNNAPHLHECIDSLYRQCIDESEFEVIIVDDGSTDGGGEVADSIAAKHNNISVLHQANQGTGMARNAGMKVARGKYLHFADADDFLLAGSYRHIVDNLMPQDTDIIVFDRVKDAAYGEKMVAGTINYVGNIRGYIDKNYMRVMVWLKLFKRSFMETYSMKWPAICYGEDTAFTWDALRHDGTLLVSSDKVYSYRTNPHSIERTRDVEQVKKTIDDMIEVNNLLKGYAPHYDGCDPVRSNFTHKYRVLFNRILCTPYTFRETRKIFAQCAAIGISHLHRDKDIKIYNLLYKHPILYFVFKWFIRAAYFARYKADDGSTDLINHKLSN